MLTMEELKSAPDPLQISEILSAFASAKVNDIPLFIKVLAI